MRRHVMSEKSPDVGPASLHPAAYFNFSQIGHNAFEFVFEFGQCYPPTGQPDIHARLVTSPVYARDFLELLRQSIERYERSFGPI